MVNFPPALATAASIAARAAGLTEIMYLPLAPRSMAEAGAAVELREKIKRKIMKNFLIFIVII